MTVLEPAAQAIVDAAAVPPFMFQLPLATGRAKLIELQSGQVQRPAVDVTDLVVPTALPGTVPVRVLRPQNAEGALPVIVYLHAGWAFGNVVTHDRLVRELADRVHAAVVFPSFSLSPEAQYPTALEEIYAVVQWIDAEGSGLRLDATRIAIAGDSAGGNMATAVAIMAKQRGGPKIVHEMLLYPTLDANFDTESYMTFATGFNVRRDHMQWLWDQYLPDIPRRSEITASPLRATIDDLEGLPAATIITAEADVVRDDGELYADKLRQAGVPVTGVRYLGTIHDFMFLDALRATNAARAGMAQAVNAFRTAFGAA